jgi:hypothetical protein
MIDELHAIGEFVYQHCGVGWTLPKDGKNGLENLPVKYWKFTVLFASHNTYGLAGERTLG